MSKISRCLSTKFNGLKFFLARNHSGSERWMKIFPQSLHMALWEAEVNALGSSVVWKGGESSACPGRGNPICSPSS